MNKLIIFFVAVLFFISCDESTKSKDHGNLEVQSEKEGYVVLHSLDGKEVKEVHSIKSGETIVFEDMQKSHVTFSVIFKDNNGYYDWYSEDVSNIYSYYRVPVGIYRISSTYYEGNIKGVVHLTIDYPDSNYTEKTISHPGWYRELNDINYIWIRKLFANNKVKLYGYVWNQIEKIGYYNWLEKDDLDPGIPMKDRLSLSKQFLTKSITFNTSIYPVEFYVLSNPNEANWFYWANIFHQSQDLIDYNDENIQLYYPEKSDEDNYFFILNNSNSKGTYKYYVSYDEIPEYIDIPSIDIDATYDYENEIVTDISISDDVDLIKCVWGKNLDSDTLNVLTEHWTVFSPANVQTVYRPTLPENLVVDYNLNNYEDVLIMSCNFSEFDDINGYDDYFKGNYDSSIPDEISRGRLYRYTHLDGIKEELLGKRLNNLFFNKNQYLMEE